MCACGEEAKYIIAKIANERWMKNLALALLISFHYITHSDQQHMIILTVQLSRSKWYLTQNLSTPRYGVVHSEVSTNNLWRVVEEKEFIDICKKCVQKSKVYTTKNT